ncbi:MAG: hypothetical protein Q9195_005467, partial [Heterodermia aff. obscurata]
MYQPPKDFENEKESSSNTLLQTENPSRKNLCHLQSDFYKQQLHPGEKLDSLGATFLGYINEHLDYDRISGDYVIASSKAQQDSNFKTVSLYRWCREVLVHSATQTFFGTQLLTLDPHFLQNFYTYDTTSWKLLYKYPRPFAHDVLTAKSALVSTLTTYLTLPPHPTTSWLIHTLTHEQHSIGITRPNIAAMLQLAHWVINANAFKLAFWLLAHILHNPSLHSTLLTETAPAISSSGTEINMPYLTTNCPHLTATYHETLRLTSSAASVRTALAPTPIGSKLLPAGTKLMSPFRQLHFDETVFGPEVQRFVPERWIRDEGLGRSKAFRPFGGGTTHCPGRFVAKQEVFMFVVVVLHRFEVRLKGGEEGQGFPGVEREKPS